MASEGVHEPLVLPASQNPSKAKQYNRIKLITGLISSGLRFVLLLVLLGFGWTTAMVALIRSFVAEDYSVLLVFVGMIGVAEAFVSFPLRWYSGYLVEHRFQLSNQSFGRWAWEHTKGLIVSLPLAAGVIVLLYYCVRTYGGLWWLPVSLALILLSVVIARLAPVLILPLFYKFIPLADGTLKERIANLCTSAGVMVEGIFTFNMSKNTKKANAGFTGIGKSKRIILGDTLVDEFSADEIETVFAHELGHYKHKHIIVGMVVSSLGTFAGLFCVSVLYDWSAGLYGFSDIAEIAALPLIGLWLGLLGVITGPLGNALSRHHERQADAYAVGTTHNKEAFVSALQKLEATNLADPHPHPVVELLFYSHPSIGRRVAAIQAMGE